MNKGAVISFGFAGLLLSGAAPALTIDFNNLAHDSCVKYVNPIHSDGYVISNDMKEHHHGTSVKGLGVWNRHSLSQADHGNAAVFVTSPDSLTTLAKEDGSLFDFLSIDLAEKYDYFFGESTFEFSFAMGDGTTRVEKVKTDDHRGLQTFAFNQLGVLSVAWRTLGTHCWDLNPGAQFDNIKVTDHALPPPPPPAPVPLPAASLLFGSALAGLGGLFGRRRDPGAA